MCITLLNMFKSILIREVKAACSRKVRINRSCFLCEEEKRVKIHKENSLRQKSRRQQCKLSGEIPL